MSKGFRVPKKEMKILMKSVRLGEYENLYASLLELFNANGVKIKLTSSDRVKKHREVRKSNGDKNVSLVLPALEYEKLKKMKIRKNMTYSELIVFLMSKADIKLS
jgi:hypothetical protein